MRLPRNDTRITQAHGDPSPGPTPVHYQFIRIDGRTDGWLVSGFPAPEGSWMAFLADIISQMLPWVFHYVHPSFFFGQDRPL